MLAKPDQRTTPPQLIEKTKFDNEWKELKIRRNIVISNMNRTFRQAKEWRNKRGINDTVYEIQLFLRVFYLINKDN